MICDQSLWAHWAIGTMVRASASSVTFSPECGENGGRAFVDTQATHPLPPTAFYLTLYKAFLSVSQACCVYTVYWLALALALAVPVLLTLQGQHSSYELGWVGEGYGGLTILKPPLPLIMPRTLPSLCSGWGCWVMECTALGRTCDRNISSLSVARTTQFVLSLTYNHLVRLLFTVFRAPLSYSRSSNHLLLCLMGSLFSIWKTTRGVWRINLSLLRAGGVLDPGGVLHLLAHTHAPTHTLLNHYLLYGTGDTIFSNRAQIR